MNPSPGGEQEVFDLDEEPLKEWILKAYHERALDSEEHARLVDGQRLLLSGPDSPFNSGTYYFEEDPGPRLATFARQLDEIREQLATALFEPCVWTQTICDPRCFGSNP